MGNSTIEAHTTPRRQEMSFIPQVHENSVEQNGDELLTWVGDGIVGIARPGVEHNAMGLQGVFAVCTDQRVANLRSGRNPRPQAGSQHAEPAGGKLGTYAEAAISGRCPHANMPRTSAVVIRHRGAA
jgi:hypothetical protein